MAATEGTSLDGLPPLSPSTHSSGKTEQLSVPLDERKIPFASLPAEVGGWRLKFVGWSHRSKDLASLPAEVGGQRSDNGVTWFPSLLRLEVKGRTMESHGSLPH